MGYAFGAFPAEIGPIAFKALQGESTFIEDFPLLIDRHGALEQTYFTFCYSPIRDETGAILGILDTVIETTEKVQAVRDTQILNAELAHRIQNMLAIVTAIADQTSRSAGSKEELQVMLMQRIAALGSANTILP